jgi:prophage regulatory protein
MGDKKICIHAFVGTTTNEQKMKMLKLPNVTEITGIPRSTIYYYIKHNQFPRPVKLGAKSVAWVKEEVENWLRQRMAQRDF